MNQEKEIRSRLWLTFKDRPDFLSPRCLKSKRRLTQECSNSSSSKIARRKMEYGENVEMKANGEELWNVMVDRLLKRAFDFFTGTSALLMDMSVKSSKGKG